MIRGDIENVVEWIHNCGVKQWVMCKTRNGKQENTVLFKSNPDVPMEQELARMRARFALSENSLIYISGTNGAEKVGWYYEEWQNGTPYDQKVGAVPAAPAGVDMSTVQQMIDAAVQKERMEWRERELERREHELRDAMKEWDRQQRDTLNVIMDKAGSILAPWIKRKMALNAGAHVAVAGVPGDSAAHVQQVIEPKAAGEDQGSQENDFTDDEANRLQALCEKYKQFDPDYLVILEKLVNWACSGNDIQVVPGLVSMDYAKIKNLIMENM